MPAWRSMFQADAFTSTAFGGNPAAVVFFEDAPFPADSVLLAIAAENNLSETAFCRQRDEPGSFDLRWFTPTMEVDLCGHATLATSHVILSEVGPKAPGVVGGDAGGLTFHTRSGALAVETLDDGRLRMDFPVYQNAARPDLIDSVGHALGAKPMEVLWSEGNRDGVAFFAAADIVQNLEPSMSLLESLPCQAVIATAPAPAGSTHDFVYRFFGPRIGIPEDPVTGSAQCSLASLWSARLGKASVSSRQLSKRGGQVWADLSGRHGDCKGATDEGARVLVSGRAVTVIRGSVLIPDM